MDSERNPNILGTPVLEVGPSVVSEFIGTNQRALDQNFHANELENQVAPQCYFNVETDSFLAVPMARSEPQTRITNHVEVNSTTRISTTANRGQTPDVVEVDSQSNASLTKKSPLKLSKNTMIKKKRTSRTTSEVWDHFTAKELEEGPIVVCNYYEKVYLCDRSIHGTSTLRKHLMNSCTTSPFWNKGKRRKLTSGGQEYGTPKQQFNAEDCRRALARMIIIDEMPFSTVEGEGFKQYSKTLQPKFQLPSRVTVARDCYKMYLEERKRLKESLKRHRICFTTDTWTSIQNLNYMSLTAHWVDDKWKLQSRVLNFCVVPDHKGETIGEKIEECLLEWEIDRIFTLTVDNATSNDSAIRYLKRISKDWEGTILKNDFMHIRCSTHIVNLIVKSGTKGTIDSVRRIRSAIQFVRGSPARTTQFKKCAEEKIVNWNVLSWDVDTRWNSTYLMLESAVVYERAFKRLEGNKQYLTYFGEDGRPPDEIDWENARQLISFLKLFYNVTVRLSGSHYVTSSAFFHDFLLMHNKLVQYSVGSDPSLAVMAIRMKQKFDKYWGNINTLNPLLFIVVALDPRYKLKYLNFCFSRIYDREDAKHFSQKVKEGLTSLFECYVKFAANSSCAKKNSQLHFAINVEEYEDDPCNLLAAQFAIHLEEIESKKSNLELSRYLAENCEKSEDKFDILGWWKGNSNKYPVLSKLAKDILAIPVSIVASESAFSTGGQVLDPFRSSLSTAMVEALICAQSWFRSSPRNMDIRASIEDLQKYEDLEQELAALVGGDTS